MDGGELMSERVEVPDEFRPVEPLKAEGTRQAQAPPEPDFGDRLAPLSATHERPPLPK